MSDDVERLHRAARARVGAILSEKYLLESLLGFGGTAAVYVANNIVVGRPCAIKVLHGEHSKQPELVARFRREALAANRIRVDDQPHPNVVDIIDAGESDGNLYLVQELLRGETFAEHLDEQPGRALHVDVALALLRPVLHAIAVAHSVGVVHRDIKPDNVFLVDRSALGRPPLPKVLDFGIAQLRDARITANDHFHGTPAYMAPETFSTPAAVDARADVWALGLMLYEALTGANPFDREGQAWYAIMHAIQHDTPPPIDGVEPALLAVLRRCLHRDPGLRFDDAGRLLSAIDRSVEPDNTLEVLPGTSAERVRESVAGADLRCNGLRFVGPWTSVGEVLAVVALEDLWPLRALQFTEPTASDAAGRTGKNLGANELAAAIAQHPSCRTLATLEVSGGAMTAAGVAALTDSAALATLSSLELAQNKVGDFGAMALADAPHLRWLQHLGLSANGIGDEGAKKLAAGALPALRSLDLSHNRITDAGARALARSEALCKLESVNLDGNALTPSLVAELRARTDKLFLVSE